MKWKEFYQTLRSLLEQRDSAVKYWGLAHSICNLHYKEKGFLTITARNILEYDDNLILPKSAAKFKEYDFLCVGRNIENNIFPSVRRKFEKEKTDSRRYNKNHLSIFIEGARLMNTYLDSLTNGFSDSIFQRKCKYENVTNVESAKMKV